jgi:hypothetical protein
LHAGLVGPRLVGGALAGVEGADAGGGEGDGLADLRRAFGRAGLDLVRGDTDGVLGQVHPVKAAGEAEHGRQAIGLDSVQHVARRRVDVLGRARRSSRKALKAAGKDGSEALKRRMRPRCGFLCGMQVLMRRSASSPQGGPSANSGSTALHGEMAS